MPSKPTIPPHGRPKAKPGRVPSAQRRSPLARPGVRALLLGAALVPVLALLLRDWPLLTRVLVTASFLMAGICGYSAMHVLGRQAALRLAAIALPLGWFAEEMGASRGWFFGDYDYTDVLGPTLLSVPVVIPLMWFALTYAGYVMANLIVWQVPADGATSARRTFVMAFLSALIVTAYDLGVDPYMVYKLKAWIMEKHDGWWFGETLQGFVGWMLVAFVIVGAFRLLLRRVAPPPARPALRQLLVPLCLYGGLMLYQAFLGFPVETRTIAVFVMGIPLFCAVCGLYRWHTEGPREAPRAPSAIRREEAA